MNITCYRKRSRRPAPRTNWSDKPCRVCATQTMTHTNNVKGLHDPMRRSTQTMTQTCTIAHATPHQGKGQPATVNAKTQRQCISQAPGES